MSDAAIRTAALAKTFGGRHPDPAPARDGETESHTFAADDRAALNAALDRLRAAGVEVEAVEPLRQSLEGLLVEVVAHTSSDAAP